MLNQATYPVLPFQESALLVDRAGYRTVVVRWRQTKDADGTIKQAHPAVMLQIPTIKLTCEPAELQLCLQDDLEARQDTLIRRLIENQISSGDWNLQSFTLREDQINSAAIAACYAPEIAPKAHTKLSKELIGEWFDGELKSLLEDRLLIAMNIDLEAPDLAKLAKIERSVGGYRGLLCSLAAHKLQMSAELRAQARKALELCSAEDHMRQRLLAVLDKKEDSSEDLMDLL